MRIGLKTITIGQNYGNRLQNYAMQEVLKEHGNKVETILENHWSIARSFKVKLWCKHFFKIQNDRFSKRMYSFKRFNDKYIKFSNLILKNDTINEEISKKYDVFVCGSDQIWNPNYVKQTNEFYLSFVKNKKKVAVSASFGISQLPDKCDGKKIADLLDDFDGISVRESAGKDIIQAISDKKVQVLCDPTFMLEESKWRKIEKKPKWIKEGKFVFCYLLGKYKPVLADNIRQYAQQNNAKVVFLENEYYDYKITTEDEYSANPSEFLWLIRNSEKVITDSFHAVVFSVLYAKSFLVIEREDLSKHNNMNSRFENLEKMLSMDNYVYDSSLGVEGFERKADMDYVYANKRICEERKKFNNFIDLHLGNSNILKK